MMLHPPLDHTVPALRTARTPPVTLVDGRVLRPFQPAVSVADGVFVWGSDRLGLPHRQLPALALAAVGTVVGTRTGDKETRVGLDVYPRSHHPATDVVEMFRQFRGEGVNTLREREGRSERGKAQRGREMAYSDWYDFSVAGYVRNKHLCPCSLEMIVKQVTFQHTYTHTHTRTHTHTHTHLCVVRWTYQGTKRVKREIRDGNITIFGACAVH